MAKIVDYYAVYIDDGKDKLSYTRAPPRKYTDYKSVDEPLLSDGIYRFITIDGLKVMITARNIERFEWKAVFED